MSFDRLEARLNRTAMVKLANATAVIAGVSIPVIFDAEYKPGMVGIGMGAAQPQMVIGTADVPEQFIDTEITVNGAAWVVTDRKPDGEQPTGLTLVYLVKA
jgi:ABC-type cobalamin transport system permease subunit